MVSWGSDNSPSMINLDAVIEGKAAVGEKVKANYLKKQTNNTYSATILGLGK